MIIPIRVEAAARPILASERRMDIKPSHPLAKSPCPVCDLPLAGKPVVLVLAGIDPTDREPGKTWVTGAAVAVHEECAT